MNFITSVTSARSGTRESAADERPSESEGARERSDAAGRAAPGRSPGGLVTYAKTGRVSETPAQRHFFASREEVEKAASRVAPFAWDGREGGCPTLEIAPGLVRLTAPDRNRREKAHERALQARDFRAAMLAAGYELPESPTRMVTGWSRKSRARMVATLAELDLAPIFLSFNSPAMVTLTYPGDWESVAPDGETVKMHLQAFFKRYERAWSEKWTGIWKLEFQRRGAPHFHLLMPIPEGVAGAGRKAEYAAKLAEWEAGSKKESKPRYKVAVGDGLRFRAWLSEVWADIVAADDITERARHILAGTAVDFQEGDRARDPKRAAVYFGKHGTFADKEYQHDVPKLWKESKKTVGRFWGYRGLSKVKGAATIDFDTMIFLGRVLRKYGSRTKVWDEKERKHVFRPVLRTVHLPRGARKFAVDSAGECVEIRRTRKSTVRARRMTGKNNAGFLLVNSGVDMADVLARAIDTCLKERKKKPPVGLRGSIGERLS